MTNCCLKRRRKSRRRWRNWYARRWKGSTSWRCRWWWRLEWRRIGGIWNEEDERQSDTIRGDSLRRRQQSCRTPKGLRQTAAATDASMGVRNLVPKQTFLRWPARKGVDSVAEIPEDNSRISERCGRHLAVPRDLSGGDHGHDGSSGGPGDLDEFRSLVRAARQFAGKGERNGKGNTKRSVERDSGSDAGSGASFGRI